MADATLTLVPWAPGTAVGAYPRRSEQMLSDGPPTMIEPAQTQAVGDDSTLSYAELPVGEYWAAAPIAGLWRYVSFNAQWPAGDPVIVDEPIADGDVPSWDGDEWVAQAPIDVSGDLSALDVRIDTLEDTTFTRVDASTIKTDENLVIEGVLQSTKGGGMFEFGGDGATSWIWQYGNKPIRLATNNAQRVQVSGSNDGFEFGPLGDANLYRRAANTLKTDAQFEVSGSLWVDANGLGSKILFGSGFDVNLYRGGASVLKTDDEFWVGSAVMAHQGTADQVYIGAKAPGAYGPSITFGSEQDTNLYRAAADTLKTDDSLHAALGFLTSGLVYANSGGANAVTLGYNGSAIAPAITFGSGYDVNLYRGGADLLMTDDRFIVARVAGENAISIWRGGQNALNITAQGNMSWADGVGGGLDTTLYRAGANVLKTDGSLVVAGSLNLEGAFVNASGGHVINFGSNGKIFGFTNGVALADATHTTKFAVDNAGIAFFGGVAPTAQKTVTGSRGANAALTSLLTALANYGLIVNSST